MIRNLHNTTDVVFVFLHGSEVYTINNLKNIPLFQGNRQIIIKCKQVIGQVINDYKYLVNYKTYKSTTLPFNNKFNNISFKLPINNDRDNFTFF